MEKLLRLSDVRKVIPLSKAQIYLMISRGEFPRPIKINKGRASFWKQTSIQEFIEKSGK